MARDSDTPVVDFGAHVYPEAAVPDFESEIGTAIYELIGSAFTDPDRSLELLDAGGIDRAVFSMPYCVSFDELERVETANDALVDLVEAYDGAYGLAAVPVACGGEAAAEELVRSVDLGLHGGIIETRTGEVGLLDDALEPVYAAAERLGAPLFVHPTIHDSLGQGALDDRYRSNAIFGREVALADGICRVVHDGVLDRHPGLDLVFHHQGGNVAAMLGRVQLQLDEGRWPGQEHVKSYEAFARQLRERIYVDTSGFFGHAPTLDRTLEAFPSSQVLFGTDHPAEARTGEELRGVLDRTREVCERHDADEVLGHNALDLLANC